MAAFNQAMNQRDTERNTAAERLSYSVDEAAYSLGCSVRFVRDLVAKKKIPYLRLGKRILIPVAGLREFLYENTVGVCETESIDTKPRTSCSEPNFEFLRERKKNATKSDH